MLARAWTARHGWLRCLRADGTDDPSFRPTDRPKGDLDTLLVLPDGKLLVGGTFRRYGRHARPYLARLLPDGSLDPTFAP